MRWSIRIFSFHLQTDKLVRLQIINNASCQIYTCMPLLCKLNDVNWTLHFGIMCTTVNIDQWTKKRKKEKRKDDRLSSKCIDNFVKCKGYKTTFKKLYGLVTTVANIIKKYKVHGTPANLPGHGCIWKCNPRWIRSIVQMMDIYIHIYILLTKN